MELADYLLQFNGVKANDTQRVNMVKEWNNKLKGKMSAINLDTPWCAWAVMYALIKLNISDLYPNSLSCGDLINKAKQMGTWVEADNYKPNKNDLIIYAWNDSASKYATTDNTSGHDHVGVVYSVKANNFSVIEGNKSNAFGTRIMQYNGRYIRGFIKPLKAKCPTNIDDIARKVIAGKYGNNPKRKELLLKEGYDPAIIQKRVNELLKKR